MLLKTKFLLLFLFAFLISSLKAQDYVGADIFPEFQFPIKYPAITPDGLHIVFLADDGNTKIAYESFFEDGNWTSPRQFELINDIIKKTNNEVGGFAFNHDGSMLLFHAKIMATFDIFYSKKINGSWTEPMNFGMPINSAFDEYSPSLSSDMKTLFILRKKVGKDGGNCKELLIFEKNTQNEWEGPKYLPEEFNIGCQETPFFCADNTTLFFSSRRKDINNEGKKVDDDYYNLYIARRIRDNYWYFPVYAEDLSNGKYNDLSPVMSLSGDYFLYNIKAPKLKNQPQKIYKRVLPGDKKPYETFALSGTITDLYTGEPLLADIIVYDAITSVEKGRYTSTDDGKYFIILQGGSNNKVDFTKGGYSHTYNFIDLTSTKNKEQKKVFDVKLYDKVSLEINVYDNELFYPLSPKLSIIDSLTGKAIVSDITPVSKGKYKCDLAIGGNYQINVESDNFEFFKDYFDLRTDVFYSNFEKSVELKATKKLVTLHVTDKEGNNILPVDIDLSNLSRNEITSSIIREDEENQNLVVALRIGDKYDIDISKKGYTYYNATIDVQTSEPETLNVKLELLTSQTKMVFNNITFETNSAELNATSYEELERIVRLMNENLEILIEISAHTDDIASDAYNLALSNKRAKSVVDYLVLQKIPLSRLKAKGYGKSTPMVPNTSAENRALNRRVELKIVEDVNTD